MKSQANKFNGFNSRLIMFFIIFFKISLLSYFLSLSLFPPLAKAQNSDQEINPRNNAELTPQQIATLKSLRIDIAVPSYIPEGFFVNIPSVAIKPI